VEEEDEVEETQDSAGGSTPAGEALQKYKSRRLPETDTQMAVIGGGSSSTSTSTTSAPAVPPTPGGADGRRSKLKRRAGGTQTGSQLPTLNPLKRTEEDDNDRPLKKLRELYDETNPNRLPDASMMHQTQEETGKLVESEFEKAYSRAFGNSAKGKGKGMATVDEGDEDDAMLDLDEIEETQPRAGTQGSKRGRDDDIIDLDAMDEDPPSAPAKKKVKNTNTSNSSTASGATVNPFSKNMTRPASSSQAAAGTEGVAPTEEVGEGEVREITPDQDESFLQALATLKKSKAKKAAMDTFDQEFNALKITKPKASTSTRTRGATVAPEPAPQNATGQTIIEQPDWALLDDMVLDVGIRGNFIRVVEFQVQPRTAKTREQPGRGASQAQRVRDGTDPRDWEVETETGDPEGDADDESASFKTATGRSFRTATGTAIGGESEGVPNFKKFKKVRLLYHVVISELTVSPLTGECLRCWIESSEAEGQIDSNCRIGLWSSCVLAILFFIGTDL
jgi:hypothetical protein